MPVGEIRLESLPDAAVKAYLSFPQRNEFLPVGMDDEQLTVWVLKERALAQADYLGWMLGCGLRTELVPEESFYPALEEALALWEEEGEQDGADHDDIDIGDDSQELLGWGHDDAPIVRLVNKTIQQAVSQGASDVHFEASEGRFMTRFRLDGVLHTVRQLDRRLQPTVLARIKVMAEMDVAETRAPQDGRIRVRVGHKDVDIRVSTVPTLKGEKAVLRILDRSKTVLSLPDLGLEGDNLALFRQAASAPHGILLVTGPTGSGKTTSLYAALSELVNETSNIMTVEDPVEYHLDGVNQVQVNRAAGVTFAGAIRAFLRQDPDIILVGEIRDEETASTAIQASLTGHLVLATLHTNDAPTAVTRLLEMGIEPFLVASSLSLAMGQRLVRLNCPQCATRRPVDEQTRRLLGEAGAAVMEQVVSEGCEHCMRTGFRGRQGIFELLPVDEGLRSLILAKSSVDRLQDYARGKGFVTMLEHGLKLVAAGRTTVEEVLRVTRL
ncbi:general secretion pathway protein E [Desulfobaculum xiamenense]|uniref:General secretion pathway protein E n=1 Tax=Desulfobaculum xiamenense TaxID=995050 RepID=A0A846QKD4_9BACT|nr:GspE/PulE family protein [Desulfobaculum xiamenense]NJB68658.1 general secretion pathway protein E [Desulfobaculum xiamenense]